MALRVLFWWVSECIQRQRNSVPVLTFRFIDFVGLKFSHVGSCFSDTLWVCSFSGGFSGRMQITSVTEKWRWLAYVTY
jgi:hypothetical protein